MKPTSKIYIPLALMAALLLVSGCRSRKQAARVAPPPPRDYIEVKFPRGEIVGEAPPATTASAKEIVDESRRWLGTKYRYGGESRKGTDCSGMVMKVFESKGIKLPRDSRSQQQWCAPVDKSDLLPADLVFFASKAGGSRVSHVGIFIGKGQFIHSSTSKGVIISSLDEDYYIRHYHSSGRVPAVNGDPAKSDKKDKDKKPDKDKKSKKKKKSKK